MKSTVLLMIALGCGLVAAVGVSQAMRQRSSGQDAQLKQVVVAVKEIDINEPFDESNIRIDKWPIDKVPPGAVVDLATLDSKFARVRLYPGEVILPGKVMDSDDTSGSVKVPLGYRVVSVKSDPETSVSNLIEPGDRVDVVVVLARSRTNSGAIAKTFLRAVRVFAVNREMSRSQDDAKSPESARTVSLLLKPEQVEQLVMAAQLGEVRLALRSPDDAEVDDTDGCTVQEILRHGSVADELGENGMLASLTRNVPGEPFEPVSDAPEWTMTMMTPHSTQKFTWTDADQMPETHGNQPEPITPATEVIDEDELESQLEEQLEGESSEGLLLTPPASNDDEEERSESLEVAHSNKNAITID